MIKQFENAYALLIGVGADLAITVDDATVLQKILTDPKRAAYPEDQVKLLVEGAATNEGIIAGLDWLIESVKDKPDATVLVYYSGHGGVTNDGVYFLVPNDHNLLKGSTFSEKISQIKTKKSMVFLDCCHAGGMAQTKSAEIQTKGFRTSNAALIKELNEGEGRLVMASSKSDELSQILPGAKYSVFTDVLVQALDGKAKKDQQFIGILDTITYLTNQVPKLTNQAQTPVLSRAENVENFSICAYDSAWAKLNPFIKSAAYLGADYQPQPGPTSTPSSENETTNMMSEVKAKIRNYVRNNKIKDCFKYLESIFPENNEVATLETKFKGNEKNNRLGMITSEEHGRINQQIANGLLELELE